MAAETFGTAIDLVGGDPYTRLEPVTLAGGGTGLRVGCAGSFGLNDGGIETVDLAQSASQGYDVTEAMLGGDVTAFVTTGPDVIHVLVSDANFITSLRRVDLGTGQVTPLATAAGYEYADLAWDGGFQLYLADRAPLAPGLRVFDAASGAELTGAPVGTGLPPFQIVLPATGGAAPVPPPVPVGGLELGRPFPNPCNPRAEVVLDGPPGAAVTVSICDLRGRRLARSVVRLDAGGRATWNFTGRDGAGRALAAGTYRVVAETGQGFAARTVTLVK
jgi:hypothetical protein